MDHFYENIFGWFDFQDIYSWAVKRALGPSNFVEIGAFLGKSTAFMAVEIINSGKPIKFTTVDTWLGSDEILRCEAGPVAVAESYGKFLENMKPVEGVVSHIRLPSHMAARRFDKKSLDFVFIDGGHHYDDIFIDILSWFPRVMDGGVIAGHDYTFEGVKLAVDQLLGNKNLRPIPLFGADAWGFYV